MYSILRTVALMAAAVAFIAGAPVWACSVQSASNGAYALSSSPRGALAPMWYEYHNWRTRNAYQTRIALQHNIGNSARASDAETMMSKSSIAYNKPVSHGYHNWRIQPSVSFTHTNATAEG